MSQDEDTPAMRALKRKVGRLMDPLDVDLLRIGTQTSTKNDDLLYDWAGEMRLHESKTARPYERVYLVVSDLKLLLASRQKIEKTLDEKIRSVRHSDVFLDSKEIDGLREKHWAVEVDGRYYELDRDKEDRSFFSARKHVGHFDRRVAARIFIGTTHFEHRALKSIGREVIASQVTYELTRNNCHRFVRVFTSLMLCRNHSAHTIPELPFGVEEHLASRKAKVMRKSIRQNEMEVFRHVGAGVAWDLFVDGLQAELRRTVRTLEPKLSGSYNNEYRNEFTSKQEQTSYISELDAKLIPHLQQCKPLQENPYTRLLQFEKVAHISIIPSSSRMHYKIGSVLHGMISGPFGGNRSKAGSFERVYPVEIMRDRSHVLRDGDGKRLNWPEKDWERLLASVQDMFLHPPTRKRYDYRPTTKTELLKSVGPFKDHPYLVDMARWVPWVAGAGWAWLWASRENAKDDRKAAEEAAKADENIDYTSAAQGNMQDSQYRTNVWDNEAALRYDNGSEDTEQEVELDEYVNDIDSEPEAKRLEQRKIDGIDGLYRAFDNVPLHVILHGLDSE